MRLVALLVTSTRFYD